MYIYIARDGCGFCLFLDHESAAVVVVVVVDCGCGGGGVPTVC